MIRSASLSDDRRFRYALVRTWDSDRPSILFVGLNPSIADAKRDDPTVRRCIAFAERWGFGTLLMGNIFALRSTDPKALRTAIDPVGPENDQWLARLVKRADKVVAAWGNGGRHLQRDQAVLAALGNTYCLGTTARGCPRHPGRLAAETRLRLLAV